MAAMVEARDIDDGLLDKHCARSATRWNSTCSRKELRFFSTMEQGCKTLIGHLIEDLYLEHVEHDGTDVCPTPCTQPTAPHAHQPMTTTNSPPTSNPLSPKAASETPSATDADRADLLGSLNELLEAERAGARVALETGRSITAPDITALVDDIHKDEVRWCSMLVRTIKSLGATPSNVTGAFYGKAMAITDLDDRLKFLNRGQAWVVRKLQALIPRIEDPSVRSELNGMLQAHHHNISRVNARYMSDERAGSVRTPEPREPSVP